MKKQKYNVEYQILGEAKIRQVCMPNKRPSDGIVALSTKVAVDLAEKILIKDGLRYSSFQITKAEIMSEYKKEINWAKVTVREIIEMLAKCDWDSECTCAEKGTKEILVADEQHKAGCKITGVSQSTTFGTQIVFDEDS